jgi:HEAT repeat protein
VHLLAEDSGAGVRAEAAAGLGDAQRRESFRALLDALGDPDEWVRGHARYSIQRIGPGTMEPWLRIGMQSPQKDVAYESADLLEHAFGYELPEDFWHEFVERKWQQ